MTHKELRELDMLIAEKVMGWKRGDKFANGNGEWIVPGEENRAKWQRSTWDGTPLYSTHIGAAWQVVEAMLKNGVRLAALFSLPAGGWGCRFDGTVTVECATAAEAICRAALKVLAKDGGAEADSYKLNPGGRRA